ncbi:MAG: carbon storage regulator [Planctomycetia bacterium]|nr:carbon storage regulator [Planctomycetia bacterium]
MLVLSRKPGERILIGNDVKITVIRIGPNSVRIGIDAPGHLNIVREELCLNADQAALAGSGSGEHGDAGGPNLPR